MALAIKNHEVRIVTSNVRYAYKDVRVPIVECSCGWKYKHFVLERERYEIAKDHVRIYIAEIYA